MFTFPKPAVDKLNPNVKFIGLGYEIHDELVEAFFTELLKKLYLDKGSVIKMIEDKILALKEEDRLPINESEYLDCIEYVSHTAIDLINSMPVEDTHKVALILLANTIEEDNNRDVIQLISLAIIKENEEAFKSLLKAYEENIPVLLGRYSKFMPKKTTS